MAEFSFEIEEKLLVLSENDKGWTKELNRVSFNGAPAKYDIRTWSPDHTKMGKGITLSNEEFQVLVDGYAASLLLEEEIVRCAAIFGLFCGNRSRNRQCTERQCRNCHQSCNAEGQNLLCSFLHVFLSFPCRYCRQIRK